MKKALESPGVDPLLGQTVLQLVARESICLISGFKLQPSYRPGERLVSSLSKGNCIPQS